MVATKLKRSLGTDGQALLDESHGADGLKAVMRAIAKACSFMLRGTQAAVATATLDEIIIPEAMDVVLDMRARLAVCGTAGSTILEVQKNGTLIAGATLTFANTDADPSTGRAPSTGTIAVSCAAGDRIALVVTTAPTAGTGLSVTCRLSVLDVE